MRPICSANLEASWANSTSPCSSPSAARPAATSVTSRATLSPFADWRDLGAAESRLREYGVPFLTILFFKVGSRGACTARTFIEQLEREHPHHLDPGWQAERLEEVRSIFGRDRVLVGQPGFAALARPHEVG